MTKPNDKTSASIKRLAILGSTGSIGEQTLDIVGAHPDCYSVYAITANNQVDRLIEQAKEFKPKVVAIANEAHYAKLKHALADMPDMELLAGAKAIADLVTAPEIDTVVTALVGYSGLLPTINAIKANKQIALANKETLVVAGDLVMNLAKRHHVEILPVDSEHSAVFQCLQGEDMDAVEKIILTASGGPFRTLSLDEMKHVTPAQALKHPNWDMGAKITIDSATMINKGFEIIEAKWLFDLTPEKIDAVVHPQSIIHSMVQFKDSSIKAQMGLPDMRLPILYALSYPNRTCSCLERLNMWECPTLTFEQPDLERFRNLALAYRAMERGGNSACVMNAANEVAVASFLAERVSFLGMSEVIEKCMEQVDFIAHPTLDDYIQTDAAARCMATEIIQKML